MSVGIKITATPEASTLATVDRLDVSKKISTSPDVWESEKVSPEIIRQKINAIASGTRASWLTAAGSSLLPTGQYIYVSDRDVRLFCETTNKFSLKGSYTSRNPVYAASGIYKGQWYAGIGSGSIDTGDILAYDGFHYESRTGNEGTAPSVDTTNWLLYGTRSSGNELLDRTTRTHASYVIEVYDCEYCIATDAMLQVKDTRGNEMGSTGFPLFQFGNDNKAFNRAQGLSYIPCLNLVSGLNYCNTEGYSNITTGGFGSYANGASTNAGGQASSSNGLETSSSGDYSSAKGISTISQGRASSAEGQNSKAIAEGSKAMGLDSRADFKYSVSRASGRFLTIGDSQASDLVLNGVSTSSTGISLLSSGAKILIPNDTVWAFDFTWLAVCVGGVSGTLGDLKRRKVEGCIRNFGGTILVSYVASGTAILIGSSSSWDLIPNYNSIDDALTFTAVGEDDKIIRWTAEGTIIQIGFRDYV